MELWAPTYNWYTVYLVGSCRHLSTLSENDGLACGKWVGSTTFSWESSQIQGLGLVGLQKRVYTSAISDELLVSVQCIAWFL